MIRALFPELTDEKFASLALRLDASSPKPVGSTFDAANMFHRQITEWVDEAESYPFQKVIRWLCADAADLFPYRCVLGCFATPQRAFDAFLSGLERRIRTVSERVLVAGLYTAREAGLLKGATPQDRYQHFTQLCNELGLEAATGLSVPRWRQLCTAFPAEEAHALGEMCQRITLARATLEATFGIPTEAKVVDYSSGAGDRHHRGRSVCVLTFADGSRLVYKPRSVSCEAAYAGLVADMNQRYGTHLPAAAALDLNDHGFVEFVHGSAGALTHAYSGVSELLAVMFLLNARDLHYENVIASTRGPVPIDLETLLHPDSVNAEFENEPFDSAHLTSRRGVGMTGLLPFAVGRAGSDDWVDLGFLGADPEGGNAPIRAMTYGKPFTDEMTLSLEWVPLAPRDTQGPELTLKPAEAVAWGLGLAEDFGILVERIVADRDHWILLLKRWFGGASVRYLHNPTWLYGQILRQTTAAQALESGEVTQSLLQRIALQTNSHDLAIAHDEVGQMWTHDVPYFSIRASERAVRNDDGHPVGVFTRESPLAGAIAKIERLTGSAIESEMDAIRMAFVARVPAPDTRVQPAPTSRPRQAEVSRDLHNLAEGLSRRLLEGLRPGRDQASAPNWIGPGLGSHGTRPWAMEPLGPGLYMGASGPTIALLAWGQLSGRSEYVEAARTILDAWSEEIGQLDPAEAMRSTPHAISVQNGLAGRAWALDVAQAIEPHQAWSDAGSALWNWLAETVLRARVETIKVDLLDGLAGTLLALQATPGRERLVTALSDLLARAVLAQQTRLDGPMRYSGAAHGIAGCLTALAGGGPAGASQHEALQVLWGGLAGYFDTSARAWWSSRSDDAAFGEVWCHGAPGILQALVAVRANDLELPDLDDYLPAAVQATLRAGFGKSVTWCHGDLGNYDLVLDAWTRVGDDLGAGGVPELLRTQTSRWLAPDQLLTASRDKMLRYSYSPGAMVGQAGLLLHVVGRLGGHRISPLRLTCSSETEAQL